MSVLSDAMDRLERNVERVVPVARRLAEENAQLKRIIAELQEELEGLKEANSIRLIEIEGLRQKRKDILIRIGKIRERITNLEEPLRGSTH
jgi:predicted  nucleic acid-binding Zn-ribbon protein